MAGAPLTCVHAPVPIVAVLAAIVAVGVQIICAGPAIAVVGLSKIRTCTSSVDGVQLLKLIVHLKIYVPTERPVTVVFGKPAFVITGVVGPLTIVHCPLPIEAALPANVTDVARQRSWSGPALAVVGPAEMVTFTFDELMHAPLLIVQEKT